MKKVLIFGGVFALVFALLCGSCASQARQKGTIEVMKRGAGTTLGSVSATATVAENRASGEIIGDTKKYGFIEGVPLSRVTTGKTAEKQKKDPYAIPTDVAEIAYTNAVYEMIQQAKTLGADRMTNVLSTVHRNYNMETGIEEVSVSVTGDAVKLLQ